MSATEAIKKCLRLIESSQQENGGFLSRSGDKKFRTSTVRHTTFAASLILACLKSVKDLEPAKAVAARGVAFLLGQKSDRWTFNYWQRDSREAQAMRYPDDLDDTFCALQAIFLHAPEKLEPAAFAHIISGLTSTEEKAGGPYNTWLVPDIKNRTWHDIDVAVNSNIGFFMKHQNVTLPNLSAMAEEAIVQVRYDSNYYHSVYPILYFLSRFYEGDARRKAVSFLFSRQKTDRTWGDPLSTALAVTALVNFGADPARLRQALESLTRYALKEEWSCHPLFIEEAKEKTLYMGAESLTAAFVLEALAKGQGLESPKAKKTGADKAAQSLKNDIKGRFLKRAEAFAPDMRAALESSMEQVLSFDKDDQILLLPYHFLRSLKGEYATKIKTAELADLGYASLCGWIAYTLYDDMLDHEGSPLVIPTANVCLREVAQTYAMRKHPDAGAFFRQTMDALEAANHWEYRETRISTEGERLTIPRLPSFGSYQVLADKSLGHVLAPVNVLFGLGFSIDSKEVRGILSFFTHYIIARQLNDDAHDWLSDLQRGFVNSSCEKVLRTFIERQELALPLSFDLAAHRTYLEEIFWNQVIDKVCKDIAFHVKKAKAILADLDILENRGYCEAMLRPIERAAKEALDERKKMAAFLSAYGITSSGEGAGSAA